VVHVGERTVDHNPSFRLFLITRSAVPALTPDVAPLLTVTNFSITRSGLESEQCFSLALSGVGCSQPCVHTQLPPNQSAGQLLSLTLQHEQPELEGRKGQLLSQQAALKLALTELEKQLLQALATSRCVCVCVCLLGLVLWVRVNALSTPLTCFRVTCGTQRQPAG
jgi:dynein heavy chain 2